jgi:hypothetical protein
MIQNNRTNVSDLYIGVYFVQFRNEYAVLETKKFIKEREKNKL